LALAAARLFGPLRERELRPALSARGLAILNRWFALIGTISRTRPDVVVYEHAERNMVCLPADYLSLRSLFWKRGLEAKRLRLKAERRRLETGHRN
jgi:hypothetical protein